MSNINLRNCLLCGEETVLFFPENNTLFKCTGCGVVFDESSMLGEGYYENERVIHVDGKK